MDKLIFRRIDEVMEELEELTWRLPDGNIKVTLGLESSELTIDQMKHILKLARVGQEFKTMVRSVQEL